MEGSKRGRGRGRGRKRKRRGRGESVEEEESALMESSMDMLSQSSESDRRTLISNLAVVSPLAPVSGCV